MNTMAGWRCGALLVAGLLAGCAPQAFRGYAAAAFTQVRGELGLQDSGGTLVLNSNMNDIDDDFGAGDRETSPMVRLEADWGRHRVRATGFVHNSSGNGVLSGAFGDIPAGTAVSSDLDLVDVSTSWSYDLLRSDRFRLGPGVQLGYYSIDMTVRSTSPSAFESLDTAVVAPMPYIDGEIDFGRVALVANAGLIAADFGDANGRYWDVEALIRTAPAQNVELIAGFRYLLMDAHGQASGRDFDADIDVIGWFVGGGVRF